MSLVHLNIFSIFHIKLTFIFFLWENNIKNPKLLSRFLKQPIAFSVSSVQENLYSIKPSDKANRVASCVPNGLVPMSTIGLKCEKSPSNKSFNKLIKSTIFSLPKPRGPTAVYTRSSVLFI